MSLANLLPLPPLDIPVRDRPLVVQSDGSMLLEQGTSWTDAARDSLSCFAHLERSPEYIHTYRVTPLSLWNAASSGVTTEWIEAALERLGRYPLPDLVRRDIRDQVQRFGQVTLHPVDALSLEVRIPDLALRKQLERSMQLQPFWEAPTAAGFLVKASRRGALKQALIRESYPAEDLCGFAEGQRLEMSVREKSSSGKPFDLRAYQNEAVSTFHAEGGAAGGAGVVVLPCGAGKTVVGIGVMARLRMNTLILTTSTVAVHQWRAELLDKTDVAPDLIGEYTGQLKNIKPITISTYQMLTHRSGTGEAFPHMDLLRDSNWGLIVYDEVHMLPAPIFRVTAEIQVRRRLGLTATLVREDGMEGDVFALIGPKRYELPWKILERQGFIAQATCYEIRLPMADELRMKYALAEKKDRFRIAAENPVKMDVVRDLIHQNPEDRILVIGQYVDQLEMLAEELKLPVLTGKTPNGERERLYSAFRNGDVPVLVVSKIANFAIDLPDASLAIQISGTFGSRQEEAQRLGRILRPKSRPARFYSLVSKDSCEQEFASHRQLFLVEQGYRYQILDG